MARPVIVNPPELPEPVGFAHAVVAGGAVYLGGQTGDGASLVEQFDSAAAKLVTALRAAGGEPDRLVSLVIYTTDIEEYRASTRELGRGLAPALRAALPGDGADRRVGSLRARSARRADGRRGSRWLTSSNVPAASGTRSFAPIAARGEPGRLNRPLVRALGEHGLLELVFAGSAVELCELREGLAHGCTEAETALALQGLGGYPILSRGQAALREEWIPRLSRGEAVAAFALSEPEAGSDAANLALRAKRERGADSASPARSSGSRTRPKPTSTASSPAPPTAARRESRRSSSRARARGSRASTSSCSRRIRSAGSTSTAFRSQPSRCSATSTTASRVAMDTLDLFRPSVGAFAVGMAQAALDAAVAYVQERHAFGQPLSGFQAVSHQLAEVATACRPPAS